MMALDLDNCDMRDVVTYAATQNVGSYSDSTLAYARDTLDKWTPGDEIRAARVCDLHRAWMNMLAMPPRAFADALDALLLIDMHHVACGVLGIPLARKAEIYLRTGPKPGWEPPEDAGYYEERE